VVQRAEDGATKEAHYPNLKKKQLFSEGYIAKRSGHTRGAAVDLTLMDADGPDPGHGWRLRPDGREIPPRREGI
jgi:D-alanyl-D-alanine dipeptidase